MKRVLLKDIYADMAKYDGQSVVVGGCCGLLAVPSVAVEQIQAGNGLRQGITQNDDGARLR